MYAECVIWPVRVTETGKVGRKIPLQDEKNIKIIPVCFHQVVILAAI